MRNWMAILLLATLSSPVALADEDDSVSFRCGLKIGSAEAGKQRQYNPSRTNVLPANYQPGPRRSTSNNADVFPQQLAKTGERRLLPVFTLARFVCSWR